MFTMCSMIPQPIPPEPGPTTAQDALYYRSVLHAFIDMGTDLARQIHQQALSTPTPAEPAPSAAHGLAAAFDRLARAVRRSIVLARKIAEPAAPAAAGDHRSAARRHIIRAVEDTIQRSVPDAKARSLHDEFLDRLDAPELEDDLQNRPVADIIAEICRDLGLDAPPGAHPWKRRTPADLAILCARAVRPHAVRPHAAPTRSRPGDDPAPGPSSGAAPLVTPSHQQRQPTPAEPDQRR
jgi:hypothetical protein